MSQISLHLVATHDTENWVQIEEQLVTMFKTQVKSLASGLGRSAAGRFFRLEGGATAVEAALVAPVFIFLVSITMELSAIVLSMRALDNATDFAARRVRVGDGVVRSGSGTDFRQLICNDMPAFTDCDKYLVVRVVASPDFATLATSLSKSTATVDNPAFNPGVPLSYVAVEASYTWDIVTPLFFVLPTSQEFSTRTVFRNEPFDPAFIGNGTPK